jgi:murein DD-endopeptidase MepM/ murein hydrolase activator NlpD
MVAHGANWEQGLPTETKGDLAAIVGDAHPEVQPEPGEVAIFVGRGPGGVLTAPIDRVLTEKISNDTLQLLAAYGATVRAPADGHVSAVQHGDEGTKVTIDHGNGWRSSLQGLGDLTVAVGDTVRRGEPLGTLAQEAGPGPGLLRFGVSLNSLAVDPRPYLLRT